MNKLLSLSLALSLACTCAHSQSIGIAPPTNFDAVNASEADMLTYNVPPEPLVNGASRAAWVAGMRAFSNRDLLQTFSLGPHLFATGSTFHVSPTGTGSCQNNLSSCNPTGAKGTSCDGAGHVYNGSGQCIASGDPCTYPQGPGCNTSGGCAGSYTLGGNCVLPVSPAAPGSACTSVGQPGVTTGDGTCAVDGQICQTSGGTRGEWVNGVCAVPGQSCTTADGTHGVWNTSYNCAVNGAGCTTSNGTRGTYNAAGTCGANTTTGGGTGGSTPEGTFATPTFTTSNDPKFSGVLVTPSDASIFATNAIQFQFTVPQNPPASQSADSTIALWTGTQNGSAGAFVQAGIVNNRAAGPWNIFYAFNPTGTTHIVSSPVIRPGDTVFIELWNTDSTHGVLYVSNISTNVSSNTNITAESSGAWGTALFEWVIEAPHAATGATMANFNSISITGTGAWNTTSPINGTPALPSSGQTVVESNAESIGPNYQPFSGSFAHLNMLSKDGVTCCAVSVSTSGTGDMTFTRSQIVN